MSAWDDCFVEIPHRCVSKDGPAACTLAEWHMMDVRSLAHGHGTVGKLFFFFEGWRRLLEDVNYQNQIIIYIYILYIYIAILYRYICYVYM